MHPPTARWTKLVTAAILLAVVQTVAWSLSRLLIGAAPAGLAASLATLPTYAALHVLVRRYWDRATRLRTQADLFLLAPCLWFVGLLHHWLSSPGSERLVAASLHLVAAIILLRTTSSAGALRRLRRRWATHRRAPFLLWVLTFAFLALLAPWTLDQRAPDGDEPWYLLVTHSLAYDFDAVLDDNYERQDSLEFMDRAIEPQPRDPVDANGRLRSRHGNALPLVLAPGYRVAGRAGAAMTMVALTALFGWLILSWLLELVGARAVALRVFTVVAITSPLVLYSTQIWTEVPAGILVTGALLCLQRLRTGRSVRAGLGLLIALALLPLLKVRFGLLSISLLIVALCWLPLNRRRRLALAVGGALSLLGALIANAVRTGNALGKHGWDEVLMPLQHPIAMLERLGGFLFDPAFGLIPFAPVWLLVIPGIAWMFRVDRPRTAVLLAVFVPYLMFAAARQEWYGGWAPPVRYALVSLPLAASALAAALLHRRRLGARVLWPPLAGLSIALGALWTAAPGWTFNFANGSAIWLDRLTQLTNVDWMLWAPSATRPTAATWLVPALSIIVMLTVWNLGPSRSGSRAVRSGVGALLLLLVSSCLVASRLPTTRIEAESTRAFKSGGHPEPPRWTFDRTRFPEAWTLPNSTELVVPVRPGGGQVEIEVSRRFIRNRSEDLVIDLERRGRDGIYQPVGGLRLQNPGWAVDRIGPVDWGEADRLRLRIGAPLRDREPGVLNGVAVDWIRLHWR